MHEYHESEKKPGWLEYWVSSCCLLSSLSIAALILLGPQEARLLRDRPG